MTNERLSQEEGEAINVCVICQADGILEAVGQWYCREHVEEGVLDVAEYVATVRGDDFNVVRQLLEVWLDNGFIAPEPWGPPAGPPP